MIIKGLYFEAKEITNFQFDVEDRDKEIPFTIRVLISIDKKSWILVTEIKEYPINVEELNDLKVILETVIARKGLDIPT